MTLNINKLGVSLMVVIGLEGPPGQLRAPSAIASPKMKKNAMFYTVMHVTRMLFSINIFVNEQVMQEMCQVMK